MNSKFLTLEELDRLVRYKILKISKSIDNRKRFSNIQSSEIFFDKRFIINKDDKSYYYLLNDGINKIITLPDNINLLKNQYNFPRGIIHEKNDSKSHEKDFKIDEFNLFTEIKDEDLGDLKADLKNYITFFHFRNSLLFFLKNDIKNIKNNKDRYELNFNSINDLMDLFEKDNFLIINLLILVFREDLIEIENNNYNLNNSLKRFLEESSKYLKDKNLTISSNFKKALGQYLINKEIKLILNQNNNLNFIDEFFTAVILFYETYEKMRQYSFEERLESYKRLSLKINHNAVIFYQLLNESFHSIQFNKILSDQVYQLNKIALMLTYYIDREEDSFSILKEAFIKLNPIEFYRDEFIKNYEEAIKDKYLQVNELIIISSLKEVENIISKKNIKKYKLIIKVEDLKEENYYNLLKKLRPIFSKHTNLNTLYIIDEISPKEDIYSLKFKNTKDQIINLIKKEFKVELVYINKVVNTKESEITRIIEKSSKKSQLYIDDFIIDNSVKSIQYIPAILSAIPINSKKKYFYFENNRIFEYLTLGTT